MLAANTSPSQARCLRGNDRGQLRRRRLNASAHGGVVARIADCELKRSARARHREVCAVRRPVRCGRQGHPLRRDGWGRFDHGHPDARRGPGINDYGNDLGRRSSRGVGGACGSGLRPVRGRRVRLALVFAGSRPALHPKVLAQVKASHVRMRNDVVRRTLG